MSLNRGYSTGVITEVDPDSVDEAGFVHGLVLTIQLGTLKVMCVGAHRWSVQNKIRKDNVEHLVGATVQVRLDIISLTQGPRISSLCEPFFTQTKGYGTVVRGTIIEISDKFVLLDTPIPVWLRRWPETLASGACLEDEGMLNIREMSLVSPIEDTVTG